MLGVLGEKSISVRSQPKVASIHDSNIFLDFNGEKPRNRSSFLPKELSEEGIPSGVQINWSEGVRKKTITSYGASFKPAHSSDPRKMVKRFVTGSKYLGQWNRLGIAGKGLYKFPHGVLYDGYFNKNGEFHGTGILIYPNGLRLEGFWKNGKLSPGASFMTKDNIVYNSDYCKAPDRRFQIEIQSELQPADRENLTNLPKPIEIPDNCYDTGEGFYDSKLKVMRAYDNKQVLTTTDQYEGWLNDDRNKDFKSILARSPSDYVLFNNLTRWRVSRKFDIESIPASNKEEWILKNCRRRLSQPLGYIPEYYEVWTSGAKRYDTDDVLAQNINRKDTNLSFGDLKDGSTTYSDFGTLVPDRVTSIQSPITSLSSVKALSTMFINPIGASRVHPHMVNTKHMQRVIHRLSHKRNADKTYSRTHKKKTHSKPTV